MNPVVFPHRNGPVLHLVACLLVFLGGVRAADAAFVTIDGPNFDLVFDSAQPGAAFYGTPTLVWNSVVFTPSALSVQSSNGQGAVSAQPVFEFRVVAEAGIGFSQLTTQARGDYLLSGAGSSVSVGGFLSAASGALTGSTPVLAAPYSPLGLADGTLKPWLSMGALDLSSLALGLPKDVTIRISSTLEANTTPGVAPSLAFIQQKFAATRLDFQLRQTDVTPVPAPDSLVLAASGFALIGALAGLRSGRRSTRIGSPPGGEPRSTAGGGSAR